MKLREAYVGEPFSIVLLEKWFGGYLWYITHPENVSEFLTVTSTCAANREDESNADQKIITFLPLKEGTVDLVIEHKRQWEPTALEIHSFHLTILPARDNDSR